jgi:hypothetical protein
MAPRASISAIQHVESAPAELERLALRKQLAAVRQNTETAKLDRRWH